MEAMVSSPRRGLVLGTVAVLLSACDSPGPTPSALSSSPSASKTVPPSPVASASCALPTEPNSLALVQDSNAQPPWVEVSVTVLLADPGFDFSRLQNASDDERAQLIAERMAQLAPGQDAIAAKLEAIGGQNIGRFWLSDSVSATVPAGRVAEVPCWPEVVAIEGDALACADTCTDFCLTSTLCTGTCAHLPADRLDLARGCAERGLSLECGSPLDSTNRLTCYVRVATGEVFAVRQPWLVELGHTTLRKCTRAEGGDAAPDTLPACP
jgi:hypothetical protein